MIAGSISIFYGMISLHKEKSSLDIGVLNKEDCTKGAYVKGYINSCITKNIINLGDGTISGISQVLIDGMTEYGFVAIPMKDNYYICVMLSDKESIKKLENINPEIPLEIYIEGEMIKSPIDINYKWYEDVNEIGGFDINNIIPNCVIKQVNYKGRNNWVYLGMVLIFCSFLTFKAMGGLTGIVEKENRVEPRGTNIIYSSYNAENEIMIQKNLEDLKEKRRKLKISAIYKSLILLLGIFIVENNFYWEIKLIDIVISVLCLKGILKFVLNMGWKITDWVLNLFGHESISSRISKCEEMIYFLEKNTER